MTTEEKIYQAATDEFLSNGFNGARMRSIAESAGINKGLLHYYFKSKEALLSSVFQTLFQEIFQDLSDIFHSEISIEEKIERTVDSYMEFLIRNPRIPFFIIGELNRDKEGHLRRMKEAKVKPPFMDLAQAIIKEKKRNGKVDKTAPQRFMLNMMSLMLFPFVAKGMVMFTHQMNEKEFGDMLRQRKSEIAAMLIKDLNE